MMLILEKSLHLKVSVNCLQLIKKSSDFDSTDKKHRAKTHKLKTTTLCYADVAHYVPGTLDSIFQGMIKKISTTEQPAHLSYKDKENLGFEVILGKNYYTNMKSINVCFSVRFRKLTNATANLAVDLIPVNNFFVRSVKEIDITKHGTNKSLIPTTTPQEIYRYCESILKILPKDPLK